MAYRPQPGPQQPGKYKSKVGPKYQKYGEQESLGYYYDPLTDSYSRDPKIAENNAKKLEAQNNPPGAPGLMETIGPVAGTAAAIGVGQSLAKDGGVGLLSGLKETVGSLGDMFGTASKAVSDGANFVSDSFGFGGADAGMEATSQAMQTGGSQVAAPELLEVSRGGVPGTPVAAPGMLQQGLGAAGAAYGAYNALQGVKEGDPVQAGLGAGGAVMGLNAMGYTLGPAGVVAALAIPTVAALAKDFFDKPSVRERVVERWDNLSKSDDPAVAAYAQQYRNYLDSDQAKVDAESGNTFNDKKKAGTLGARDVWGGAGIIKNIPGWLTDYSEPERERIAQAYIDADLVSSKEGDIVLKDVAKAKDIAARIKSGETITPPSTNTGLLVSGPTNVDISSGGAKGAAAAAPAVNAGLLVGARPVGFDPDPNNPGKFIRRK